MAAIKKIEKYFLDILFPVACVFCEKEGDWICEECFSKIEISSVQTCPFCEKNISPGGKICPACRGRFSKKNAVAPLSGLVAAARYKKSDVSRLVHLFKYGFIPDISLPLGRILLGGALKNDLPLPDIIVPVPLHPRRLRWRGFNQSELLAVFLGETMAPGLAIPVEKELVFRKKNTSPQMKIGCYQERQRNVSKVFSLSEKSSRTIKDKNILLVDDICTTGATLFEIGKILKKGGAGKVWGIVVARQDLKS